MDTSLMSKLYIQRGYLHYIIILAFVAIVIIVFVPLLIGDNKEKDLWLISCIILPQLLLFLLLILCSYKMTLEITDDEITLILGIGWIKRHYPLSKIQIASVQHIKAYSGIGLRFLGNGWLYNITLGKAVQIAYKNKTSVTQFGFDQAEEIVEEINRRIVEKI